MTEIPKDEADLKGFCAECPSLAECSNGSGQPCEKLEEELKKFTKEDPLEVPVSQYSRVVSSETGPWGRVGRTLDDFLKPDIGRLYEDVPLSEVDWYQTSVQSKSADLDPDDQKSLFEALSWAMRDRPKQKQYFRAFLKCSKIADIAKTANTSAQNLQKQFQRVIQKVHKIVGRRGAIADWDPVPLGFKTKVRND